MSRIEDLLIFEIALGLLAFVVVCLVSYLVLRLAITHAMKAHTNWLDRGKP
jgi:hypothetical protein